jgi:hypothetical protein
MTFTAHMPRKLRNQYPGAKETTELPPWRNEVNDPGTWMDEWTTYESFKIPF